MVLTADYREQKRGFVKWSLGEQKMPRGKGGGRPWSKDMEPSARGLSQPPAEPGVAATWKQRADRGWLRSTI